MTVYCWGRERTGNDKSEMRGFLRSAPHKCLSSSGRNDGLLLGARKNRQRQKRNAGVSPLRRQSAPPSVEMTCSLGWAKRTSNGNGRSRSLRDDKQRDKQRQRQVAI